MIDTNARLHGVNWCDTAQLVLAATRCAHGNIITITYLIMCDVQAAFILVNIRYGQHKAPRARQPYVITPSGVNIRGVPLSKERTYIQNR